MKNVKKNRSANIEHSSGQKGGGIPILLYDLQRGRATAVMIGVEAYEKSEHEKELLRLLAKGDREMELGEGYDLDTLLAEADTFRQRNHNEGPISPFFPKSIFIGISIHSKG